MVQSLPGFLDLCLNVCSPSQVLGYVYTEVLEAAHPLHRSPADHKRSVGPLLSLPEVYNQLFNFAHVQRETVLQHHDVSLSTSSKYAASSLLEMRPRTTVSSANLIRGGAVRTRSRVCRESRAGDSGHSPVGLLRSG